MPPDGAEDRPVRREADEGENAGDADDELSAGQLRRLALIGLVVGVLFLVMVLGITAASHVWGIGGGQDGPPDTTFSVESVLTDGELTANVTNDGPAAASPDEIVIEVDDERRGTWTEIGGEAGAGLVAPGNSATVPDVAEGQTVQVYWTDGEEAVLLGQTIVERPA